jgi:glycosyltransferase involved in cell wall biosynthesis
LIKPDTRRLVKRSMDSKLDIAVLVTCYNEEDYIIDTLDNVIAALSETGLSHEVIVIDDMSKDKSVQKIEEYIENHPEYTISLKVNKRNCGWAHNFVDGAFLARGKYYRVCCGDNVEPKDTLVQIFKHVGKADMVIPYHPQKDDLAAKPFFRRILSKLFVLLIGGISGHKMIKYYNGMAIHLRYNVMRWAPRYYGFGFQAELISSLLDQGATYCQVPVYGVKHTNKEANATNVFSSRNVFSVMHTLLEMLIRRVRRGLYDDQWPKPIEITLVEDCTAKGVVDGS